MMRTLTGLSWLLAFLVSLTGCHEDHSNDIEVVTEFFDAFEERDLQRMSELLSADVVWEVRTSVTGETDLETLERYVGNDAVSTAIGALLERFEPTRFSDRELFEAEDHTVFAELVGDLRVRCSGEPYRNLYLLKVLLDRQHHITRVHEYMNPIHLAHVLGIDLCAMSAVAEPGLDEPARPPLSASDASMGFRR